MAIVKCPKCNSSDIDKGVLWSVGGTTYKSDKHKVFFNSKDSAYVCLECGYMEFYVEKEYLEKVKSMTG